MRRDPLIDLLHRRTAAGWINVLVLLVVGMMLSAVSGNAHIGNWTTNDNGFVTRPLAAMQPPADATGCSERVTIAAATGRPSAVVAPD